MELVGKRPGGGMPIDSSIVQVVSRITQALGFKVRLSAGSTDANIPMSLGIPSITIDGGGMGFGTHSEQEMFNATNSAFGTKRAALLAVVLTEP